MENRAFEIGASGGQDRCFGRRFAVWILGECGFHPGIVLIGKKIQRYYSL